MRCKQSNMNKFYLTCFDKYDRSRVQTWLMAALCFNAQRLLISYGGILELPRRLLSCNSLRELEIRSCTLNFSTKVWCYSNLETLILSHVTLSSYDGCLQLMAPRLVRLEIDNKCKLF